MDIAQQLKSINPTKNYPSTITIVDTNSGKPVTITYNLCSYFVGLYMSVTMNGERVHQSASRDQTDCVKKLKQIIKKAAKRNCQIEIGSIQPIKKSTSLD